MINLDTILLLIPEISLVVLATWVIVASAFQPTRWWAGFCALIMAIVAMGMWRQDAAIWQGANALGGTSQVVHGPIFVDAFGHLGRWLALSLALLFLPLVVFSAKETTTGECLGTMVLAFTGLMIVSVAADLILMVLGLELISIPTYILLFLGRNDRRGPEATAKYFFLSILSSAVFLYGLSFIYGAAGSTHLAEIHHNLRANPDATGLKFLPLAVVFVFVGLGFKIAAVPFHFYAPDVYQATTNANAGLLAILPKAAGVIAFVRITAALAPSELDTMVKFAIVVSIASMTLGNVCALWQTDLRRMLAYSSIAHAGYMLIGLATGLAAGDAASGYDGFGAMFFYLIVYCVASLGSFATLAYLSNDSEECATLEQIAGLPSRHPIAASLLAVFMFSLSGIPPLAGFWGKMTLFTSALTQTNADSMAPNWFVVLLIVAALNAAIAAGYYLRVIAKMYFGAADEATASATYGVSLTPGFTVVACGLFVILCGLRAGPLIEWAGDAGKSAGGNRRQAVIAVTSETVPDIARID